MMAKLLPDELNVHVEEIPDIQPGKSSKVAQQVIAALGPPQLEKPKKREDHFKHPTGKTTQDFVLDYLQKHQTAKWAEMSHYIVSLGYNKSSINNAITRLAEKKLVERIAPGIYKLVGKHAKAS
jgi:hypothetical protein